MKASTKKKILIGCLIIFGIGTVGNIIDPVDANSSINVEHNEKENKSSKVEKEDNTIYLKANELGDFGSFITINKNADPKTFIAYHLPVGSYKIVNTYQYPQQLNVCVDGVNIVDGREEQVYKEQPFLFDSGEEINLTIESSKEYITLGSYNENDKATLKIIPIE